MRTSLATLALTTLTLLGTTLAHPSLQTRDAPFEHVRTRLDQDHSATELDRPEKYFHEAKFASHYDGRFADRQLPDEQKHKHLVPLIQTYLSTMLDIGVETFIVHGTLLGWWWNRSIMPWDDDVDVMVTESSIRRLAAWHNMTVHTFRIPALGISRDYLLEVNPHYANRSIDGINAIDARWIDMDTGVFIDITTIRRNQTADAEGADGAMMVKDNHHYKYDDVFPLRDSVFEGLPVKVPFAYSEILLEEYGPEALTQDYFREFRFDSGTRQWVPRLSNMGAS